MTTTKKRATCIHCDAPLLQDPWHAHWSHCINCNPTEAHHAYKEWQRLKMEAYAAWAANDQKGRPTRNGEKE